MIHHWIDDLADGREIIPPVVGVPGNGDMGYVPEQHHPNGPHCGALDEITGCVCDGVPNHSDRHVARYPEEGMAFLWPR